MKQVLLFITDGFADWEASYVTAELNQQETGYYVKTVAINKQSKKSMGGLTVVPDYSLADISFPLECSLLILPGGTGWREEKNHQVKELVEYCFDNGIPVAAICDATTFLGMYGFLDHHHHTGNSLSHLQAGAPNYRGTDNYIEKQSVSDRGLITANGSGAVEFSRDILETMQVLEGNKLTEWYDLFKNGYLSR
ncbi:type 1 glutamine amidotransferase family protein [Pontibacillus salicampi]|uniref:Type 1 glutamine amidotransferase family protein n=1 Tax=Pontibacillus salicampi TaxID=1449801 RepID=A0ABV6LL19_9BACI